MSKNVFFSPSIQDLIKDHIFYFLVFKFNQPISIIFCLFVSLMVLIILNSWHQFPVECLTIWICLIYPSWLLKVKHYVRNIIESYQKRKSFQFLKTQFYLCIGNHFVLFILQVILLWINYEILEHGFCFTQKALHTYSTRTVSPEIYDCVLVTSAVFPSDFWNVDGFQLNELKYK